MCYGYWSIKIIVGVRDILPCLFQEMQFYFKEGGKRQKGQSGHKAKWELPTMPFKKQKVTTRACTHSLFHHTQFHFFYTFWSIYGYIQGHFRQYKDYNHFVLPLYPSSLFFFAINRSNIMFENSFIFDCEEKDIR